MKELQSAATTAMPGGSGKSASTAKPNDALVDHAPSVANQEKLTNSLTAETDDAGTTTLAQRVYKDLTIETRIDIRTRVTVTFQDDLLQRPLQSSKQAHLPVGGQSQHDELQDDNNGDDNFEDHEDDGDDDDEDDEDDDDDDSSNDEDGDVGDEDDDDEDDSSNDENDDVGDEDEDEDDGNDDYDDGNGYDDYDDYDDY